MRRAAVFARPVIGAIGLCALVGLASAARAETAAATDAAATDSGGASTVETVVVTARRVEENIQDVPGAITAVTTRQLELIKPRTLQDLSGISPNVMIGMVGAGAGSAAIYIRGLGYQDIEKGQNPAVGLLIDDVVIGTNTAQLIDSFDIQQVEIDRGPQGIFYGKNTTAGAINIHRSRPTHAWGANVSIAGGDYGQNIERGIFNAPIGDSAGLKIGISHRGRQGFLNNIYTHNDHYGKDDLITGTIALDWNITPKLDVLATADFTHQYGEGTPVQLANPLTAAVLGPILPLLNPALAGIQFNSIGSPYLPGVTVPLGVRQVANDFADRNLLTQQRYSLNVKYDSPIGQFVSVTAFINQHDDAEQDFDGSCGYSQLLGPCPVLANPLLPFLHTSRPQKYKQFSEEARFSHDFGDKARLLAGVYYFHHEISAVQLTRTAVAGVPVTAPLTRQISGETNSSISGFANFDYNLTDRLKLSAGIRYIHETKNFHNGFELLYFPGVGPVDLQIVGPFQRSNSWNKAITRFSADYKLTDNSMIYASRSEGFRSGGFSPRSTLSESIPGQTNYVAGSDFSGFKPETNVAYEIGSKNRFFDGQLTLNLAAFWTKDHNHQQSEVVLTPGYGPGTNTYIVNVPEVEIKGAELEAALRPDAIRGLTLSFAAGYQKAEVKKGVVPGVEAPVNANGTAGAPGSTYDLTGSPLERVPRWTLSIRGDYDFDLGPGKVDLNAGYKWQDDFVFTTLAKLPDIQPAYGLLDASVSYSWDRYKLTVSGKNLTNKDYRSNSLPVVFFQGWGEPRTFLVELQARW